MVCAIGLGVAVASARAGLDAYRRGSLPQIPVLMAATTKALVDSLPGQPAAAPAVVEQAASGPAVPDSTSPAIQGSDSGALLVAPPNAGPALPESASVVPVAVTTVNVPATGPTAAAPSAPTATPSAPVATPPAPVAPPPASVVPPALAPIVAEGRTELSAGVFVVRSGETVTVYFDTPEARTRRPEKFEQIVRATLPAVHGKAADALLAAVAPGALIGAVDLVNELPTSGLHLRSSDGRTLSLYPETRPGRDGPLVVAYRATPSR